MLANAAAPRPGWKLLANQFRIQPLFGALALFIGFVVFYQICGMKSQKTKPRSGFLERGW
jgi:hypothetical protein